MSFLRSIFAFALVAQFATPAASEALPFGCEHFDAASAGTAQANSRAAFNSARALRGRGAAEVEEKLLEARALCPTDVDINRFLASFYQRQKQVERADKVIEAYFAREALSLQERVDRAFFATRTDNVRLFLSDMHVALSAEPTNAARWFRYAIGLRSNKLYNEALEAFEEARRLSDDRDPLIAAHMARILDKLERKDAAAHELVRATEGHRLGTRSHQAFAKKLAEVENLEAIFLGIEADASVKPLRADTLRRLAVAFRRLGHHSQANIAFAAAEARNRDNPALYLDWGNTLQDLGRYEEAIRKYTRGIELEPDHPFFYNNMGNALIEVGRLKNAIEAFNTSINLDPSYRYPHSGLGRALLSLGQPEDALVSYETAYAIDPKDHIVRTGLARALSQISDRASAINRLLDLQTLQPKDPIIANALLTTALKAEEFLLAMVNLEIVAKVAPGSNEVLALWEQLFVGHLRDNRHLSCQEARRELDRIVTYAESFESQATVLPKLKVAITNSCG
ncbi:MAG: tetratricopeptide repeat protein [Pseudomonadota bacterium]